MLSTRYDQYKVMLLKLFMGRELVFLEMLGSFNIGPSVLALFQNGRIEQFLPSTTLKNEDIRNPEISRRIGRLMAQLHLKVPRLSTGKVIPEVWANINMWYDMSVKLTTTEDKKKAASMEKPNLDALRGEIDEYIKTLRDGLKTGIKNRQIK